MNSNRKTAIIVGVLILAAYGVLVSLFTESLIIIVLFEEMSGGAVIAIAVLMFPILKPSAIASGTSKTEVNGINKAN